MSWRNLSLSEKEQNGFILPKDHRKGEFVIAAKFFTSRFLQMEAVAFFITLAATQKDMHVPNTSSDALLSDSMAEINE